MSVQVIEWSVTLSRNRKGYRLPML